MSGSTISVPVETATFLKLSDFLKSHSSTCDPVTAVGMAIDYWLDNAAWKAEDLVPGARPLPGQMQRGYHWKELFLPHGTSLRMKYSGDYFYAAVEGDRIIFEGQSVSPSEFANRVTNTSRNAWRDIWIRRPDDREWVFADSIRKAGDVTAEDKVETLAPPAAPSGKRPSFLGPLPSSKE